MGTLIGHVAPGAFCLIIGFYWSFMVAFKFVHTKLNPKIAYRATITQPCICITNARMRRAPLESFFKILLLTAGFLGELICGIRPKTIIKYKSTSMTPFGLEHVNSTVLDDSQSEIIHTWFFLTGNAQHMTIYGGIF